MSPRPGRITEGRPTVVEQLRAPAGTDNLVAVYRGAPGVLPSRVTMIETIQG